jgi:hypothetical protein
MGNPHNIFLNTGGDTARNAYAPATVASPLWNEIIPERVLQHYRKAQGRFGEGMHGLLPDC